MSETRRCIDCRYFDPGDASRAGGPGLCRFTSPTLEGWPPARPNDWCGEWTAPRTRDQVGEEPAPSLARVNPKVARQVDLGLFKEGRR